jgi:hypothetical protein
MLVRTCKHSPHALFLQSSGLCWISTELEDVVSQDLRDLLQGMKFEDLSLGENPSENSMRAGQFLKPLNGHRAYTIQSGSPDSLPFTWLCWAMWCSGSS